MNKTRFTLNTFGVAVFILALTTLAQAQATRTWVSGVGDDVNPCSRTAPCKTFAGAISKTAENGEIDAIDPGGFGAITITKSITIDGGGTFASVLASGGVNGVNVNVTTNPSTSVVILRNLSINGANTGLNGIRYIAGKALHVENCQIFGFTSNGIDANLPAGSTSNLFVSNTNITRAATGIHLVAASGFVAASIDHVKLEGMSSNGLFVDNNGFATIRDSGITFNITGVLVQGTGGASANLENCVVNHNTTGITAGNGTTTRISNVSIEANGTGINGAGGTVSSSGNNRILGNTSDGLTPGIINQK